MSLRPHSDAIYQIDPHLFRDAQGRGWGTLDGITEKLDYLVDLGVTVLWILPFYVSGHRDGGYDVVDHCAIDPRLGDDRMFADLVRAADARGLKIVVELVMQHTSDLHAWFQAARRDRESRHRRYYIWTDAPEDHDRKPIFPPVEAGIWRWDAHAGQYYRHLFYAHEPDLELADVDVRSEMWRIMRHWRSLGVAGFRIDAAPYMVERAACTDPRDGGRWLLKEMAREARRDGSDAILMGEADVGVDAYDDYLQGGLSHLLDFHLNNHLFLALAREDARELARTLGEYGQNAPPSRRLAWLRNNDELDLEQLEPGEREEIMEKFAPLPSMRIYRRGIRRRLAPMLEGNVDRIAMAHALLFSLGQVPVLRYGDEIGIGDEPELPERNAVRTPMQWHGGHAAGFTDGPAPWRAPIDHGRFDYRRINVAAQQGRRGSLLERVRALLHAKRGLPALDHPPLCRDAGTPAAFAASFGDGDDGVLALVNLSGHTQEVALAEALSPEAAAIAEGIEYLSPTRVRLSGYGYAWLRGASIPASKAA